MELSMNARLGFDFTCPNGHKYLVSFDKEELRRRLTKQFGRGIWCADCQQHYQPTPEWLVQARKTLDAGHE
jgi:hypothetical protein